jgi:outer membrane protein
MIRNIVTGLSLLFSLVALLASLYPSNNKTVYIDMGKLYDGFKLSQELNRELEQAVQARTRITDSLYRTLKQKADAAMQKGKNSQEELSLIASLEEEYLYKQKQFEEENRDMSLACNEKIWSQINQYVMDYGKARGYRFILGANGQGNIMYGDKETNLTQEITHYLNEKYEGRIN